jgi:hypothetical protein
MGGVDIANQLRAGYTTLRHQNLRYWKPLFYWLLDIALTNSYLLYKAIIEPSGHHRGHQKYLEALAKDLMDYSKPLEPLVSGCKSIAQYRQTPRIRAVSSRDLSEATHLIRGLAQDRT